MPFSSATIIDDILTLAFSETITRGATTNSGQPDMEQHFEKLCHVELSNGVPVEKFRSHSTGLHVILAKVEGPLVSGYFTLGKALIMST